MLGVKTLIVNLITAIRTLTNKRRRSSCIDARRRGCFDGVKWVYKRPYPV